MNQKTLKIIFWLATGFVVFISLFSGVQNILITDTMREINKIHGFNLMLLPFFGILKILGAITILTPALKRLKEGAYAGFIFYFIGATYVNIIDGSSSYKITIIILIAVVISYLSSLKLQQQKPLTIN